MCSSFAAALETKSSWVISLIYIPLWHLPTAGGKISLTAPKCTHVLQHANKYFFQIPLNTEPPLPRPYTRLPISLDPRPGVLPHPPSQFIPLSVHSSARTSKDLCFWSTAPRDLTKHLLIPHLVLSTSSQVAADNSCPPSRGSISALYRNIAGEK